MNLVHLVLTTSSYIFHPKPSINLTSLKLWPVILVHRFNSSMDRLSKPKFEKFPHYSCFYHFLFFIFFECENLFNMRCNAN